MSPRRYPCALIALVLVAALATVASATPPVAYDDFHAGIDPGRWTLHDPGGGTWMPAVDAGNGYVTSPSQASHIAGDRMDNMLSTGTDFSDFDMTWNWRFRSQGADAERRDVYFRCDDQVEPNGYWLHVDVNSPVASPASSISIKRMDGPYPAAFAWTSAPLDYTWQLDRWYSFRLRVSGNTFQVKAWLLGDPEPAAWLYEVTDPGVGPAQGRIGFGDYWDGVTDADNVVVRSLNATTPPYPVRNPQVPLSGNHLQKYLDGLGESINVFADQLGAQTYIPSVSGNSAITLMIELGKDPAGTTLGLYDPLQAHLELYEVFPGNAAAHWSAMVSFLMSGDIVVNLFNASGVLQGNTVYPRANLANVGFYLAGRSGRFFSEDARNGGVAQALMFAGTGRNGGDFWVCWEDQVNGGGSDLDFDDAVLLIQSLQPVPTTAATWGRIKAQYR